jgi:type I restriction enzyme S subunit
MEAWPTVPIGELFRLKQGTYLKPDEMSEGQTDEFPIPVYGANGIIGYSNRKMYDERTTLVSCRGANCGVVHYTVPKVWISNNSIACVPKAEIDPTFYYYVCKNTDFGDVITGSAQPQITITNLSSKEFVRPPLPVQRRIAGILSAYDELMENIQRRIRILEAMARALYCEWFVHFRIPAEVLTKAGAGPKLPRVASPLGDIPKGWEVKKLGDVANITMGLSPKGDTYNEEGDGTPLVNGPVEFGERFTKQVKWTTAATKFCKEGDLVVCVRGSTTGKYVKSDGTYCLGRGVCGLSSKYQCFVDLLFENELPTLLGQTSGSTFPSWTGPQLKNHPVQSPPPELLARFEVLVKPMSDAVLGYSRKIQNLRRTRDLLLPRLLSGQVNLAEN